jgi:hypothetical protein
MGFDLVSIQDQITAKIKATLPNTPVNEDGVLDDANLMRDSQGQLIPYIVLRYGSIRRHPNDYSIAGTRFDGYYATVDVSCVAPVGRMARQMLDVCTDALIGFKPTGQDECTTEGLPDNFPVMNNMGRPTAFVASVRFRHGANGTDAGGHMTPPSP